MKKSQIVISVQNPLKIFRMNSPVVCGVPIAESQLWDPQNAVLEDDSGNEILCQKEITSRWPDGSGRWILLQFLTDIDAKENKLFRLRIGDERPHHPQEDTVSIQESADAVLVDNGLIYLCISKRSGDLTELRCRGEEIVASSGLLKLLIEDEEGNVFVSTGPAENVAVEDAGPVRSVVKIERLCRDAKGKDFYRHIVRLYVYKGLTRIRALQTFSIEGGPDLHSLQRIGLLLSGHGRRYILGGEQGQYFEGMLKDDEDVSISHMEPFAYILSKGSGHRTSHQAKALGWCALRCEDGVFVVSIKNFWQLYPKELKINPNSEIEINLWPKQAEALVTGRTRANTHELFFSFFDKDTSTEAIEREVLDCHTPLIGLADTEAFRRTEVFGLLCSESAYLKNFNHAVATAVNKWQERVREDPFNYGMMHYGDYIMYQGSYGSSENFYGDNEYDTPHTMLLQFVRTHQRHYFELAEAAARHMMDVDVDQLTGKMRFHGYRETKELHRETYPSPSHGPWRVQWDHTWVDGVLDYYFLTGDRRSLEMARKIGDAAAEVINENCGWDNLVAIFGGGAERTLGWALQMLVRLYQDTLDEKYLTASKKIVDYLKLYAHDPLSEQNRPGTFWFRAWLADGAKTFMSTIVATALFQYYRATGDAKALNLAKKGLDWLIEHMWDGKSGYYFYEYNAFMEKHRELRSAESNAFAVEGLAYGHKYLHDRRYFYIGWRAFSRVLPEFHKQDLGKQAVLWPRYTLSFAAVLEEYLHQRPHNPCKFYISFDNGLNAQIAHGRNTPIRQDNISFDKGKFGDAVCISKGSKLAYSVAGHFNPLEGTIAFWIKPHWTPNPYKQEPRAFVHLASNDYTADAISILSIYQYLLIRVHDHAGNLSAAMECEIGHWQRGQWHQIVLAWDPGIKQLYLDGQLVGESTEGEISQRPPKIIWIGHRPGEWYAEAAIDEFYIFDRRMSAEDIRVLFHRGFVWMSVH